MHPPAFNNNASAHRRTHQYLRYYQRLKQVFTYTNPTWHTKDHVTPRLVHTETDPSRRTFDVSEQYSDHHVWVIVSTCTNTTMIQVSKTDLRSVKSWH